MKPLLITAMLFTFCSPAGASLIEEPSCQTECYTKYSEVLEPTTHVEVTESYQTTPGVHPELGDAYVFYMFSEPPQGGSNKKQKNNSYCMDYLEWDKTLLLLTNGPVKEFSLHQGSIFDSKGKRVDRCGDPAKIAARKPLKDFSKLEGLLIPYTIFRTHSEVVTTTWDTKVISEEICKVTIGGTAPVPEPSTLLIFGTGLMALAATSRRKK